MKRRTISFQFYVNSYERALISSLAYHFGQSDSGAMRLLLRNAVNIYNLKNPIITEKDGIIVEYQTKLPDNA